MKLSNIKGEKTLDVIADLVAPVANIAMDDEASDLFRRKPLPAGMRPGQFLAERAKKSVPALLKTHKDDIITILSVISLKTREEYMKDLNIVTLVNDLLDILNDDVFGEFFTTAQTPGQGTSSGSVQVNTKEEA